MNKIMVKSLLCLSLIGSLSASNDNVSEPTAKPVEKKQGWLGRNWQGIAVTLTVFYLYSKIPNIPVCGGGDDIYY